MQYMIVLFLLFLIQFSIASSCLAVNSEQQQEFAEEGWNRVPDSMRKEVQDTFLCCGFNLTSISSNDPSCELIQKECCSGIAGNCQCPPCLYKLEDKINYAFKLCGGLGIFFSFTEFIGVWLTVRYRNQKDPRGLPGAFL
ncbi:tetraspanin-31-like [Glossina fuscipes fuscipes]